MKRLKNIIKQKFSFSFSELLTEYEIPNDGCLHVGANIGTEIETYETYRFKNIVWIEGYKPYFEELEKNIKNRRNHFAFNFMVSDIQDEIVNFKVASNTGSSTIFEPTDSWYETFSDLSFQKSEEIKCSRIDDVLKNNFDDTFLNSIKFLVMDIEGAELKALHSMGSLIDTIEFAFVEVSLRQNFRSAPLMIDIDRFFLNHSFKKVFLKFGSASGDALYKRVKKVNIFHLYYTILFSKFIQTISLLRITDRISNLKKVIKNII